MSKYTTGEIAKLCGVTVRTVQYYDTRGILIPGELTEGGRRLYSEDDLRRMKTICFLRELGLPIGSIAQLLNEEHPEKVVSLIIEQQQKDLEREVAEKQTMLKKLSELKSGLSAVCSPTIDSIGDIASVMQNKEKLNRLHLRLILIGLPVTILQWTGIILWITKGIHWVFAVWVPFAILYGIWASKYYFSHVNYICPACHAVFRPTMKEAFWARHTPKTRKLTCTACGHHGFCVEVYREDNDHHA